MAYRVEWDASATDDVMAAAEYLELRLGSRQAAASLVERIMSAEKIIEAMPDSYPRVLHPYLRHRDYRKAPVGKYVLLYRVAERWASIEDGEVRRDRGIDGCEGIVRVVHLRHVTEDWEDEL